MAAQPSKMLEKIEKKLKKPRDVQELASRMSSEFLSMLKNDGKFLTLLDFEESFLQEFVERAEQRLAESIEKSQSPFRISMIGTFSSGKTVTLCALLKKPRMLPSSNVPTSGNVVEIQIVPPGHADAANRMTCVLFSLAELEHMLRDYYEWLQRNDKVKLSAISPEEGFLRDKIVFLRSEVREVLRERWTQQQQKPSDQRSLKRLAHLYFILIAIDRYLGKYQENTAFKQAYTLTLPYAPDDEEAKNRLKTVSMLGMQWSVDMLHPEELERMADAFWQQTPQNFKQFSQDCESGQASQEALRALFPLYKRIILTQEMALPGGWGEIERLSVLDFPGLNSGSRRDVYLCLKELDAAHANMLFLRADLPNDEDIQELMNLIVEAKTHHVDLPDRVIPIINFFDAYRYGLQEFPEDDLDAKTPRKALQRVRDFFSKEDVAGVRQGFDVFDQRILGNLRLKGDWRYHLISPSAALDPTQLERDDQKFRRFYEDNKGIYGQLLGDVKSALSELKKDKANNRDEIAKCERLQDAIEAYLHDGGIEDLRTSLGETLREKGARLIVEDARVPLFDMLKEGEQTIIQKLREEDLEIDDPNAQTNINHQEHRTELIALWNEMKKLTETWISQGTRVEMKHKKEEGSERAPEYESPLELCQSQALDTVLRDDFWKPLRGIALPEQTTLKALGTRYAEMRKTLNAWTDRQLEETVAHTLEYLEKTPLHFDGHAVSFDELRNRLFNDYVENVSIGEADKRLLSEFFGLRSEKETLCKRLRERREQEMRIQQETSNARENDKPPFNEYAAFTWSPFEVMKIQRQMILTLQRCMTDQFGFYMSVFFDEFSQLMDKRVNDPEQSLNHHFERFAQPHDLFDQLAEIPEDEQDEATLSKKAQKKKAKEVAQTLLNVWNALLAA